jgi:hypothetical protein
MTPKRWTHRARLENNHQTMTATVPISAPMIPAIATSGIIRLRTSAIASPITINDAATMPGQSRSLASFHVGMGAANARAAN